MRDLLLVSIVIPLSLIALRRPWVGVMLWTWLSIMNPHRYTYGFAYEAPLAAITAVCTLVGILFSSEKSSPFKGAPVTFFALLTCWITLSWLLGMDVSGDFELWTKVMKIYLMTFAALIILHSKHQIVAFAWVTAGSLAILGTKGGVFTILTGGAYHVRGPAESYLAENNALAVALIMCLPVLYFLYQQLEKKWMKLALAAVMLLCVASALGSQSRGALLAISAMGAFLWLRSRNKGPVMVLIVLAIAVLVPMMPDTWWRRMETIGTYDTDASAQYRLYAWGVAWEVAKHHLFGAGMTYERPMVFLTYGNTEWQIAAHSIYFQILANHGFVGLFLFLFIWITTYSSGAWLRKNARSIPQATWAADLGSMIQVSLVGYAVGGAFLSLSYFDLPYNMMVLVVLARKWVQNHSWEREPPLSFLEYVGLRKARPPLGDGKAVQGMQAGR